jgi:hypothetical protein
MSNQQPILPAEVATWVTGNPELVHRWMTEPSFRRELLSDPASYGLSGAALDWVNQRIKERGIERLVGEMPGHLLAM